MPDDPNSDGSAFRDPDTPGSPTDPGRPPVDTAALASPPPPPPGYLPPAYPAPPKQRGVAAKVLTSLLATVVLLSLGLNVYLGLFYAATVFASASEVEYRPGVGEGDQRVVVLPINGGIDDLMADYVRRSFDKLDRDVPAAVVLRVTSGGGGVTASDQIWHRVTRFQAEHPDVKVVASLGAVAASGGYYVAAPADHIVCEQTGITGSIGVMAQIPAVEGMIEKLGVEMNVVVADGSAEKATANNLFENWKDDAGELTESGEKNEAVLKNLLNSAWERFVTVVDAGRDNLDRTQVEALASGDVFTAAEAAANGLADSVGYLDDAIDKAIELAALPEDARVTVIRQRTPGLLGLIGASSAAPSVSLDLDRVSPDAVRTWINDLGQARLEYRMRLD
ncbi:MAG: S49 family peptidase [Planctomycetota bacterium]